jgi:hypothetical protein
MSESKRAVSRAISLNLLVFLAIWVALVAYFFLNDSDSALFWFLALCLSGSLLVQIWLAQSKRELRTVLFELIIAFVALQFAGIARAGPESIFGLDTSYELNATQQYMNSGWTPNQLFLGSVGSNPALQFLGAAFSFVLGSPVMTSSRWLGLVMYTVAFAFYILIGRLVFASEKPVLLSALAISFSFIFFGASGYGRTPLSILFFFMFLYVVVKNGRCPSARCTVLAVVMMVAMVLSHILPSMVMLVILCIFVLLPKFMRSVTKNLAPKDGEAIYLFSAPRVSGMFIVLFATVTFAYAIYFALWNQLEWLNAIPILVGETGGNVLGIGMQTPIRWRVFMYGQVFLGLFLLYAILRSHRVKYDHRIAVLVFSSCVITAGAFLAYYLRIEFLRFTIFGWGLLLPPAAFVIWQGRFPRVGSLFVIAFIVINLAGCSPQQYDRTIESSANDWQPMVTHEERLAVLFCGEFGPIVGDWYFNMASIDLGVGLVYSDMDFYKAGYEEPSKYSYFLFDDQDRERVFLRDSSVPFWVTDELYSDYQVTKTMVRIYDSGPDEVYWLVPDR